MSDYKIPAFDSPFTAGDITWTADATCAPLGIEGEVLRHGMVVSLADGTLAVRFEPHRKLGRGKNDAGFCPVIRLAGRPDLEAIATANLEVRRAERHMWD